MAAEVDHGSCLCGSVKYTISGEPMLRVLCHCVTCKKASGSAFAANGRYAKSQVQVTSGQEVLKTYKDKSPESGSVLERSFCGNCGSPLFIAVESDATGMAVTSGTLDKGPEARWAPDMEFYSKRREGWLEDVGAAKEKRFKEMP